MIPIMMYGDRDGDKTGDSSIRMLATAFYKTTRRAYALPCGVDVVTVERHLCDDDKTAGHDALTAGSA